MHLGIISCAYYLVSCIFFGQCEILDLSVLQCHDTWGESDGVKYNSVNNILSHKSIKVHLSCMMTWCKKGEEGWHAEIIAGGAHFTDGL